MDRQTAISRFHQTFDTAEKAYTRYAKAQGLNFLTFITLRDIFESEAKLSQKELAKKHGIPKQVINAIIKNFIDDGIVTLEESKDRRIKKIALTPKGGAVAKKAIDPIIHAEQHIWDDASTEDIVTGLRLIEMYARKINDITRI